MQKQTLLTLLSLLLFGLMLAGCASPTTVGVTVEPTAVMVTPTAASVEPTAEPTTVTTEPTPGPMVEPTVVAAATGETVNVEITLFELPDVTVKAGDTVVWLNNDAIVHSVTAGTPDQPTGTFDSDLFDQGLTYSNSFPEPGEFTYFCQRHNFMQATVTVEP